MTALPSISVVVVSWQRPEALRLCLLGLQQQDHPALELCLVIDPEAADQVLPAFQKAGWTAKIADNAGGNISIARNAGLAMAQGDIVAFIDDDAVAEPTWACRLAKAFLNPAVVAATGYTIGRNGISLQWSATEVDATGQDHALPLYTDTTLHQGSAQRAIKPVGTNCAFRRTALMAVGGFDPAYRFYLEDADVGLRLAALGLTAVVPSAQVHHAFAASSRRRSDRVPTDLHQIGASVQVFLRRHLPDRDWVSTLTALRAEQQARLARHCAARRMTRAEAARLMATLESGFADGASRALDALVPMRPLLDSGIPQRFSALPDTGPRPGCVLAGRIWQRVRLRRQAEAAVLQGQIVTVFCFSPSFRAQRMSFQPQGFWLQTGGLFGRSLRRGRRLRLVSFRRRVAEEVSRISDLRPIS
jgi:O-antigen biosynthesis protein